MRVVECEWGWEYLPVDDVGYRRPAEVLALSDPELRAWTRAFERRRYGGWRNWRNLWRESLGLDDTRGQNIIDYGCGFGIEALQFARTGNCLCLVDLTEDGLEAAQRVLAVHGHECVTLPTTSKLPDADVFYANGVLHHFPEGMKVLSEAPAQEARVMVYSDRAATDTGSDWRQMDGIGGYAEFFTPARLESSAEGWTLREATYITPNGWYLTAVLDR